MKSNAKVSLLNKNSFAYRPAIAPRENIIFEFKTAWAGTLFTAGAFAFVRPNKPVAELIASTVVAVMGAQHELGKNEKRQSG